MNMLSLLFLCFALLIFTTDAHYGFGVQNCRSNTLDGHDAVYTLQIYYNKQLVGGYNSTDKLFRGYTENMKEIAEGLNKNQKMLLEMEKALEKCRQYFPEFLKKVEPEAQEPRVRVFSTKTGHNHQPGLLVCSAYSFYPKSITLTWLRNEEEVKSGVTFTDEMNNGNWFYQKHSYLEYTPTATDRISCMVEHASLSAPKLYSWDSFPESRRNKLAVGTTGLLLGLVIIILGVIHYKKHSNGRVLVPYS